MLRSGSIPPGSCAWGRCFRDCSCLSTRSLHLSRLRGRSAGALCAAAGRGSFGASPLRGPLPTPPPQAGEGCACGCACELAPMTALAALLLRDMRLAVRVGGGALMGVLFFLLVVTMVPFGVGPDLKLLARIGPAILWIGALLATLLGLDRLLAAARPGAAAPGARAHLRHRRGRCRDPQRGAVRGPVPHSHRAHPDERRHRPGRGGGGAPPRPGLKPGTMALGRIAPVVRARI